ncbi:hypothetical protein PybrP1_004439 [[Pythium] brassicae (nom. inval.)]|nr:hypothetical protein PybrP1_004439 [[Pythium] brassicae (nom. inval.)]
MPLLSFEGVEVDIPTSLAGIQFAFKDGALSIQCANFTGNVVLTKSVTPEDNTPTAASKKRPLASNGFSNGEDDEDDDDSDNSASELLTKRLRPNFLNDVEQSMLLAQLKTASQSSSVAAKLEDGDSIVSSSGASVSEKELSRLGGSATKAKPPPSRSPTPSSKASAPKKASGAIQTTLFSPDASKQLAARKATPESQKKRGRPPKAAQWAEVAVQGVVPAGHWGDSATKISGDRVVVYGGADDDEATLGDVHVFDLKTREWSKPLNCESIPRAWHDAVYLEAKHLLLVIGGERFMGDGQIDVLSDIMVLDTECFLWYPPAVSGTMPSARSGHTCTVVGDDVVVFGGSRGRNRQSTVHILDSDTWHWKAVKVEGKPPSARTYHSAVAVGDRVVIFGGNDAKKSFNSVHVLQKKAGGAGDTWSWFHPCVVGTPPQARTGHSATLVDDSSILVFGGWDPQSEDPAATKVFDDAFLLNTDTWEWAAVALTRRDGEQQPLALPGRVGHRAVVDASDNVIFFGGQDAADKRLSVVHSVAVRRQSGSEVHTEPDAEAATQPSRAST